MAIATASRASRVSRCRSTRATRRRRSGCSPRWPKAGRCRCPWPRRSFPPPSAWSPTASACRGWWSWRRHSREPHKMLWAGRILSGLVVLFLVFDGTIKLVPLAPVIESMAQLGYPAGLERGLGVLTLACGLLYAVPRTSVLGAVLLTGLLGGAIATHLRVG